MINRNKFYQFKLNGRYLGEIIECAKCSNDIELPRIQKIARCPYCSTQNFFKNNQSEI